MALSESGRRFRYGGNTAAMVLLAIAVLVLANLLVMRLNVRWDLTEGGVHTLSDQTKNVLDNLDHPVRITGFYSDFSQAARQRAQDLLKEYQAHSNSLQIEWVNPDQNPGLARQKGIQQDAVLVLEAGDRRQDVTSPTEAQLTSALLKLTSARQTTVYFVTGHGERSVDDSAGSGFSMVRAALERDNFQVQSINLATASDDAWKQGVLVINSGARVSNVGGRVTVQPAAPLLPQEVEKLTPYLKEGGRVLILLAPGSDASYGRLVSAYGLKPGDGVVLDPTSLGDVTTPAVQATANHTITEGLPLTIFPQATGLVDEGERPSGVLVQLLMQSSADSWLETNPRVATYDEGQDTKGPLRLAATVEQAGERPVRAVLVGSADAFANGVLQSFIGIGNMDFFLNSVNWLAQQEEAIGIRPRGNETPTVVLTAGQQALILLAAVTFFPALIIFWGIGMWWSRR